jgi:hypothetical protein
VSKLKRREKGVDKMKKGVSLSVAIGLFLVIGICVSSFAQEPFPYCTDTPEYCQKKVAQVPIPWQFWGIVTDPDTGITTVTDRIRISPTWLNPPPGQPAGEGGVFVQRQFAVASAPMPLEGLVWDFITNTPPLDLEWEVVDEVPKEVMTDEDLVLEIPLFEPAGAVLVAYEVRVADADVVGNFINEAVLESKSPTEIVEIRVNFDIHNDTGLDVTNFELNFLGLDFECDDVEGAVGFIAAEGIPPVPVIPPVIWGANPENPLVVRPIPGGTEVKWIQPDRPLHDCEWLHVGLAFDCTGFDCFNNPPDPLLRATVQGYWTVIEPCPEKKVYVDIKPGSCPNPLRLPKRVKDAQGKLPLAILGTGDLDIMTIDPATIKITRECEGCEPVEPLRWAYEDVATPFEGELCDCHELGPDGYMDLTFKFRRKRLAKNLKLYDVAGETIPLTITGNLKEESGGTPIEGEDCVRIKVKKKK